MVMPAAQVPLNYTVLTIIDQYYRAKQTVKANNLAQKLFESVQEEAKYYSSLKGDKVSGINREKQMCITTMYQLYRVTEMHDQKELSTKIYSVLQGYNPQFGREE
jgi:hypothetical protein